MSEMPREGTQMPGRLGLTPQVWEKFGERLRAAIVSAANDPDHRYPVALVLRDVGTFEPPPDRASRAAWAAERESRFAEETHGIYELLEEHGAENIRQFWLNRTLSARVDAKTLQASGLREEIRKIVLADPHKAIPSN